LPAYAPFVESDPVASASLAAHGVAGDAHAVVLAAKAAVAALSQEAAERVAAVQAEADARILALAAKADLVNGRVPTSQIPAVATGETITVASQAAMLALTAAQVQPGDVAIRSDQAGRRWLLAAVDPSLLGSWIALEVPDAVSSVQGQQGAVILGKGDVGLGNADNTADTAKPVSNAQQAALDLKLASNHASVTNARVPTAHNATHATGGTDVLTPVGIGAAPQVGASDVEITVPTQGLVLRSPNGTRYRLTVGNLGTVSATAIP
jgi:hypothetical protein